MMRLFSGLEKSCGKMLGIANRTRELLLCVLAFAAETEYEYKGANGP